MKALIVVDMQKAFFNNDDLEAVRADLIARCNELIERAKLAGSPIFFLRTEHEKNRETWTLNMLDDNEGYLFSGDDDAQFVDGLATDSGEQIIKTRDSGFYKTDLEKALRQKNVDEVVLCGVSSHTCVAETAADAYNANLRVELAEDAIASHIPKYHEVALEMLEREYRMKRKKAEDIDF